MSLATMPERKKPGPKPDPSKARNAVVTIRCTERWKDWLARYAVSRGTDLSDLIDEATLRMARDDGFEMPPKR